MSLLTRLTSGLVLVVFILSCGYLIWRCIFQCSGYHMKKVLYKSSNLIIQKLKEGRSRTLIVMGNDLFKLRQVLAEMLQDFLTPDGAGAFHMLGNHLL